MFFRKKINTPDTDTKTQVNTITAQQTRNRSEEVFSERRQAVVGEELNVIYSKIKSTMN